MCLDLGKAKSATMEYLKIALSLKLSAIFKYFILALLALPKSKNIILQHI